MLNTSSKEINMDVSLERLKNDFEQNLLQSHSRV